MKSGFVHFNVSRNVNCLIMCHRLNLNQYGVLIIRGALPEDAGNYTCLATNEAGSASQSVSLTYAGSIYLLEGADVKTTYWTLTTQDVIAGGISG